MKEKTLAKIVELIEQMIDEKMEFFETSGAGLLGLHTREEHHEKIAAIKRQMIRELKLE